MKIVIEPSPAPEDEQVIWRGLRQPNEEHVSAAGDITFAIVIATRVVARRDLMCPPEKDFSLQPSK